MNIENHIHNSKTCLDCARDKIVEQDYDTALAMLSFAYSNVRILIGHVFELKRSSVSSERPAGKSSGGP